MKSILRGLLAVSLLAGASVPAMATGNDFKTLLGIPVKVNADSGGKPNGIPERR